MTEWPNERLRKYIAVFENVNALYRIVKTAQQEHGLPLRRAAIRSNGEVAAESIDFLCDCELKAKRVLFPVEFEVFKAGLELPEAAKADLGEVFFKCQMSVGGQYKSLYFHVKQVMDGKPLGATEYTKPADPAPSLEDYDRRAL
jgi:hypothetical protein